MVLTWAALPGSLADSPAPRTRLGSAFDTPAARALTPLPSLQPNNLCRPVWARSTRHSNDEHCRRQQRPQPRTPGRARAIRGRDEVFRAAEVRESQGLFGKGAAVLGRRPGRAGADPPGDLQPAP